MRRAQQWRADGLLWLAARRSLISRSRAIELLWREARNSLEKGVLRATVGASMRENRGQRRTRLWQSL